MQKAQNICTTFRPRWTPALLATKSRPPPKLTDESGTGIHYRGRRLLRDSTKGTSTLSDSSAEEKLGVHLIWDVSGAKMESSWTEWRLRGVPVLRIEFWQAANDKASADQG